MPSPPHVRVGKPSIHGKKITRATYNEQMSTQKQKPPLQNRLRWVMRHDIFSLEDTSRMHPPSPLGYHERGVRYLNFQLETQPFTEVQL